MTLPEKDPKAYLELKSADGLTFIVGEGRHVAELEALFRRRGIPCDLAGNFGVAGWETLALAPGADPGQAAQVLKGYKNAKGS